MVGCSFVGRLCFRMEAKVFDDEVRRAVEVVALVSGLPLAAGSLLGLLWAFIQALLQIQEQSIGFAARLVAASGVAVLCGAWFWEMIVDFIQQSFMRIAALG